MGGHPSARSPERCWQDVKSTGFLGCRHREGAFEERRMWHLLDGGRSSSQVRLTLFLPVPLTERDAWVFCARQKAAHVF